jgi:hypothetical protein
MPWPESCASVLLHTCLAPMLCRTRIRAAARWTFQQYIGKTMIVEYSDTHKALVEMAAEAEAREPGTSKYVLVEALSAVRHLCDQYELSYDDVLTEAAGFYRHQQDRDLKNLSQDDDAKAALPMCDWVYFATPSGDEWTITKGFVSEFRMILRTVYDSRGNAITNVRNIRQGDTILLVYGGGRRGKPYRPMFSCTVVAPRAPVPLFENAFTYADHSMLERLQGSKFSPDPHLKTFTGISIEVSRYLEEIPCVIQRPEGNRYASIQRWNQVFDVPA